MKEKYEEKDNTWVIVCVCIAAIVLLVVLLRGNGNYQPPVPSSTITSLQMRIQRLEQHYSGGVAQHSAEQDPPVIPRLKTEEVPCYNEHELCSWQRL